jgi:hypothetical protein
MSLEFTPDGAQDIRLRLSERAGEVHLSVHSTDAALTGHLREGIHDLVGSLSDAGYDADAWTPGQQRQQQQQRNPEEERKPRTGGSGWSDGDYDNMLQTSQENL